jgi:predicted nucleic acid-binding protein
VIVVDASAVVSALLNDGPARRIVATEQVHAPHLLDAEVASGLRRRVTAHQVAPEAAWAALGVLQRLGMTRYAMFPLLDRMWELRQNLTPYDASYVALAELLDVHLLTADARLGQAPGIRCPVTVVPR